jgi:midasin
LILLGNRLHVINLSQQSDAVDLLGGYKPFDPLLLLKQIYRDFSTEQLTNEYIEEVQVTSFCFCKYFL